MRVLIVEDDRAIASATRKHLSSQNYAVDTCATGNEARDYLRLAEYDVVIMDVMLPDIDGLTLVREARSQGLPTPILFLTARDSVADRVIGLDAGGDDYLTKPFALDELSARIRVLTRRSAARATNELIVADLTLNTAAQIASRNGKPIPLTGREFALLELLMRNQNTVLSRERIEQRLFSYDYMGASNMIDVYIRYLRKKIDQDFEKKLIHTVRGVGYVLREEP